MQIQQINIKEDNFYFRGTILNKPGQLLCLLHIGHAQARKTAKAHPIF